MRLKHRLPRVVLIALAVAIGLRVLLCLAAPAQLHHSEEFVNLRLAAAVVGESNEWSELGLDAPIAHPGSPSPGLFDYQYQDWDGGTLVVALLLVPIAVLGGLSVATVKAGAILWSLAIALAWVCLVGRLWGRTGQQWTALAMAAVPVPYLIISSIHWGNHAEGALFLPLVLGLLCVTSEDLTNKKDRLYLMGSGLLAGFGTYFSLLNLAPMLLVLLCLPLFYGRRSLLAAPVFSVAAGIGFLPWLGRNTPSADGLSAQGINLSQFLNGLGSGEASGTVGWVHSSWPRFGTWDLHRLWNPTGPFAAILEDGIRWSILVGAGLALALCLANVRGGPKQRRRLALVLVMVGTYLAIPILLERSWQLNDRRLAALYPIGWILLVIGALSLPKAPLVRRAAFGFIAILMFSNLAAAAGLIASWDRPNQPLNPWSHFAIPKTQPHLRIEAGIGDLAASEARAFYASYAQLLQESDSGGEDEMRGFRRAVTPGPGGIGALRRPPPVCPDALLLERSSPSQIASSAEARGFGAGLAFRCPQDVSAAKAACLLLPSDSLRAVCVQEIDPRTESDPAPESSSDAL